MKEFTTAVRAAEEREHEDYAYPFVVDGRELVAYRPTDGQSAILMAAAGRFTSLTDKIAGAIDFFVSVMDEESRDYLVGRLLDRDDDFGMEEVEEILEWLTEEWTGRPTKSSSVSTPQRRNGGRNSTRTTTKPI